VSWARLDEREIQEWVKLQTLDKSASFFHKKFYPCSSFMVMLVESRKYENRCLIILAIQLLLYSR